jgi:hypothetical protein
LEDVTKPQGAGAICGGLVVIAMMQFCYVDLNGSPNINSHNKKLIMSFCFWVGRIYRSFYFQQMAMVGSAVTLDIAVQLMEAEQITNEDVMSLISGFSMFLRDPSDHVLGQLLVTINHL